MADAQRTIDLIFNGVDKTGAATLSALSNVEKFSGNVQRLTEPIAAFTLGAVKLEAGLLAAGVAMTTFAVKTAGDFDASFRQISTLVDASAEDLGAFRQAILDYASSSTKPLEDITASLSAAIGSGVDMADSLGLLAEAEKLAVATRADLTSTTETLVSTLNAYGMKTSDAGKVSDLFFQTIKDGKIEMTDLSASLARVTPIAATAGISLQEVGAVIATLTAGGMQPSSAIDALRSAITNIIKPSEQAKKLAEELGIQFNVQALQSKGLSGVLDDVARATGGSADKMAVLFGDVTGLGAVLSLTGKQADTFKDALVSMGDATGSVQEAFAKMAGSVGESAQKASNALTALLVGIGTPLLDEFGGIANAVAAIFAALGTSVKGGALKDVVGFIEGVFGDLQETLQRVATNLPKALENADLSGFTRGIQAVVDAFRSLFGGIDLTTVDGLTRAVELAGAAFLGLSKFTAGVVDSFKPLFDFLVKLGGQIDKVNPGWLEFAGNIGGAVTQFNLLLGGIGGLVPALEVLVGRMVARNGLSLLSALSTLTAAMPALVSALGVAGVAFAGAFAIEKLYQIVTGVVALREANQQLAEAQERARVETARGVDTLERFNQTTGLTAKTLDEAIAAIDSGAVVWSDATSGWVAAGSAMASAGEAAEGVADPFGEANRAMLEASEAAAKAADAAGGLGDAQKGVQTYTMKVVEVVDEATGKIIGYTQQLVATEGAGRRLGQASAEAAKDLKTSGDVMGELSKKTDLTNKELIELARNVKDAEIKLEEIASNERIKSIEARVTLDVARLEADTERVKAAFSSIDNTVNSTGDLLGELYGLFGNFDKLSFSTVSKIEDQMDLENKRRDDALKLQRDLTQAQIDNIRAQTQKINQGDALIKVDGAGLQPHLEAFMWEILRTIQVRVNQDGLKMLLGV